jgi:nitroimidazol reductase NimA-like FMN-containing flavoprotein (pyridoxamine 5'-phosphate oxidase superfamily)
MKSNIKGPWSEREISDFLHESRYPLRLACVGADGYPRVVSVWFSYSNGRFFCASHSSSQLVTLLRANARVGFEVATNDPPYCGVRGQGDATLAPTGGAEMLETLLQRYLGSTDSALARWLLSRAAQELLITVTPQRLFSWDYRQRMTDLPPPP